MELAAPALLDNDTDLPDNEERRGQKSGAAYRTISEVAIDLNLPQHVLRFWETKFKQISPLKRGGGRRYYRPQDIDLIKRIHYLLYTQGYTIKGVQKLLAKDRQLQNSVPTLVGDDIARVTVDDVMQRQPQPAEPSTIANATDMQLILQRLKKLRAQCQQRC